MTKGETYCVVDMAPLGVMLTGPSMSRKFNIIDRTRVDLCPPTGLVMTWQGIRMRQP